MMSTQLGFVGGAFLTKTTTVQIQLRHQLTYRRERTTEGIAVGRWIQHSVCKRRTESVVDASEKILHARHLSIVKIKSFAVDPFPNSDS